MTMSSTEDGIYYGHRTDSAEPEQVDPAEMGRKQVEADREQALRVRSWLHIAHEPATPWAPDEPFDDLFDDEDD